MTYRRMRRWLVAGAMGAAVLGFAGVGQATVMVDFEAAGFVPGETVDNHRADGTNPVPTIENINLSPQAFFVPREDATPPADEEIVDLSGSANPADAAHGKVWRLSNGTDTGSLGGAPQSPHFSGVAGETGALNDAGRGAPTTNTFYAQVDFRSATGLPQAGLGLGFVGAAFDQRQGFVRILDDGGTGLDLQFFDTIGDSFNGTFFDLDLARDVWHTLAIEVIFHDGFASGTFGDSDVVGNDVVNVYLNDLLIHTGTSWESFYAAVQDHAEAIDSVNFARSGIPGGESSVPAHLGGGLYYDNLIIAAANPNASNIPLPGSAWLLVPGLLGLAVLRRRRAAAAAS